MTITVYGKPECTDWARSRSILEAHSVSFEFHDILADPQSAETAQKISGGLASPVIVFEDHSFLVEPSDEDLTESLVSHGLI